MKFIAMLGTSVLVGSAFAQSFTSTGGPYSIPDNDPTGVTATVNVSGSHGALQSITFDGLNHTWIGDMTLQVMDPSSNVVTFLMRPGWTGTGFGFSADLSASNVYTFAPGGASIWAAASSSPIPSGTYGTSMNDGAGNEVATNFSSLTSANGTWSVMGFDAAGGDTGGFNSVTLNFAPVPEPASMAVLGLGALALIRKRRAAKK